jgi:hypothetical protein
MIKQHIQNKVHKSERGQAIILIAFAIIGLVAMVGLVTDTGILLIEYGKLKRGVDAAAVAAAQQYRLSGNVLDQTALENAAINFLQLNQSSDIVEDSVIVHSCESPVGDRPALCNPDPGGHPNDNRKLVEVIATKNVYFGFLRVIGIDKTTVTANAVGEAATIDMVLMLDNSGSMAYETSASPGGNDPSTCNPSNTCQPMRVVKDTALDFLDTLYFPYDRVAVVTMTGLSDRNPVEVLGLTSNKADIVAAINGIKVFQPRHCDPNNPIEGSCLFYDPNTGIFLGEVCEIYEFNPDQPNRDPSSCPSSNVGGALNLARTAFTEDPAHIRLDAFWVVVNLIGGPANATEHSTAAYPNGFCPPNTWLRLPWCRDRQPTVRHSADDPLVTYINPISNVEDPRSPISLYDPDDYARDMADDLATSISGQGVTIFTIGLGEAIKNTTYSDDYFADGVTKIPPAEDLLKYIAECAGEGIEVLTYQTATNYTCGDPDNPPTLVINHGQYFYAPNNLALGDIFDRIAKNIATKISQ